MKVRGTRKLRRASTTRNNTICKSFKKFTYDAIRRFSAICSKRIPEELVCRTYVILAVKKLPSQNKFKPPRETYE